MYHLWVVLLYRASLYWHSKDTVGLSVSPVNLKLACSCMINFYIIILPNSFPSTLQSCVHIQNWKKRWFVLRKKDPFDPASVELVYYADPLKKELRGTIPVKSLLKVYHTPTKNKSEHVFAVDMDDKKFLLKATDHNTKSIWLAKLMELISNGGQY